MSMEMPTSLVNITSDPPEDLTVLRVVGDFVVSLSAGNWTLGCLVQDHTWTPGATVSVDNDKRVLWSMTYNVTGVAQLAGFTTASWEPPGQLFIDATTDLVVQAPREAVHIDISPKVKIQAGQALYLVAWENSGAGTFTTGSNNMRVLFQRSRRR